MGHIPDGKYLARAKSWAFGAAGTGTEQIAIEFEIADGGDENGKRITWYGFFNTEENGRRAIKSMRACGWDETGDPMEPNGLDKNDVELDIQEEEYNGKSTSKVRWVNALGAGITMKPLAADQRAKLTGKLKQWMQPAAGGQRRQAPAGNRAPPSARKTEGAFDPGPPVDVDDIPF